jgi:hypothetical protein
MTTRSKSVGDTAEWPAASPRAAALVTLVSARAVARADRHLEDALSALDLTSRVSARARGIVGALERAD